MRRFIGVWYLRPPARRAGFRLVGCGLPALFASGMALVDVADNVLMVGAYGWAFSKPQRKLHYNMTITGTSVVVARCLSAAWKRWVC